MSLKKTREFVLKEKMFSIKDKVKIMTTDMEVVGIFASKILSIGRNYRLYEGLVEENEILTVKEKAISLRSQYTFYKGTKEDGKKIGKMKQKLVSIKPKYWFEDPDENKLFTMKGNFWRLKYQIFLEDKPVAEVSKKLFKIKDTYGLRIDPSVDDDSAMLILGIVVMLHEEKEEQEKRSRRRF
jgi:uncharacterized protein YxjI